jgi:hypothetical protein
MNSHIDLGQPNITKINVNSEHHPEEKTILPEKPSIVEKQVSDHNVIASTGALVMPSISKDSPIRKENNIKMSMYFI